MRHCNNRRARQLAIGRAVISDRAATPAPAWKVLEERYQRTRQQLRNYMLLVRRADEIDKFVNRPLAARSRERLSLAQTCHP